MGKKVISFSVWGSNPKYCVGVVKNVDLAKKIYPEWICYVYVSKSVPEEIIQQLEAKENCQVFFIPKEGDWTSMLWRFLPIKDFSVDLFICRDADSRLGEREAHAVKAWEESGFDFHIMRDHPYHFQYSILGGMFGAKRNGFPLILEAMNRFNAFSNQYGCDYIFFESTLFPAISKNSLIHDDVFHTSFPSERIGLDFVGKVFDQDDNTVVEHEKALEKFLKVAP
jgi:hypothetical protein